jgi:hypothetical protein
VQEGRSFPAVSCKGRRSKKAPARKNIFRFPLLVGEASGEVHRGLGKGSDIKSG